MLIFSFVGNLPATITTRTRSPRAAGAIFASRSSVGPFSIVYSSTADQSTSFGDVAPPEYAASHFAAPRDRDTRAAIAPHASELILPSLYTPNTDTTWWEGVKSGAKVVAYTASRSHPAAR